MENLVGSNGFSYHPQSCWRGWGWKSSQRKWRICQSVIKIFLFHESWYIIRSKRVDNGRVGLHLISLNLHVFFLFFVFFLFVCFPCQIFSFISLLLWLPKTGFFFVLVFYPFSYFFSFFLPSLLSQFTLMMKRMRIHLETMWSVSCIWL